MRLIQKIFSKDKEDNFKTSDRITNYLYTKAPLAKYHREYDRAFVDGDKKKVLRNSAIISGTAAIPAYLVTKALIKDKLGRLTATAGSIGAGIGTGLSLLNKYKDNPKLRKRRLDQIRMAEGKMSKEEFIKKYYKK